MGKKTQIVFHFAFAKNTQTWWDIEICASKVKLRHSVEEKMQAQKMLDSTKEFTGELNEVGILVSEPEPNLPYNYSSALSQHY